MKDCRSSSIGDTSRIVKDSVELTKVCLKYAVDKVFQNNGHQSYWAETEGGEGGGGGGGGRGERAKQKRCL